MSMQMDRIGSRPIGTNHDNVCPSTTSGMDYLRNPRLFKGMGFALDERQALGIHGLLPPRVKSQAEQTDNCFFHCHCRHGYRSPGQLPPEEEAVGNK